MKKDNNSNEYVDLFSQNNVSSADSIDLNSFTTRKTTKKHDVNVLGHTVTVKTKRKKGKNAPKAHKVLKVLLSLFLVGIITGCLIAGAVVVYAFAFVNDEMADDLDNMSFTTTIFVQNQQSGEWEEYQRLHGEYNRVWIPFEDMPENLINAYVAIEDKRFYDHQGIDWKRTVSAFANLFFHFYSTNQGGSTITQQLVKNLTGDNSTSPMRKVREIMRARQLENSYSKDTIIECYLNTISMAGGRYGVEVAANYYFGKKAKDLTLTECAALASIAKAPETYRPDKNPENNKRRRALVLGEMLSQGKISQAQYDESVNEELNIVAKADTGNQQVNSYFTDAVIEQVVADLSEKYNYDKTYAAKNFYNGGYKIYATMDPKIQEGIDKVFLDKSYITKSKKGQTSQSAITVMDYEGHIVGLCGGLGEKTTNRGYNRATQGTNQAGSTMKPMGAYALAIENNLITYSTVMTDEKVNYGGWSPKNWYRSYWGKVKVHYALERSINIIPIKLVDQLTPQASYDFCTKKIGLTTLTQDDINLSSLAIGGNSIGITVTQSAGAYAIFGNGGKYYKPKTYYRVENQLGKVVLEGNSKPVIAIGEDSACVMNHLLQGVVYGANGTAKGMAAYTNGSQLYGKTGTSDNANDSWFVGGTPYYVASCWYGFDQDEKVSATGMAKKIWGNVMKIAHANKEAKNFEDSELVVPRYYCTQTGLCANEHCPSVQVGWYKESYAPACTTHGGKLRSVVTNAPSYTSGSSGNTSSTASTQSTAETAQAETPAQTEPAQVPAQPEVTEPQPAPEPTQE